MNLIDSSVWISYYRPDGSEQIKQMVKEFISSDLVAINGIIVVEVLSGISRQEEMKKVESGFKGFHFLALLQDDFFKASSLGSTLRRKGFTIPSTDLIIAASALKHGHTLYHLDNHFDLIAEQSPLKVKNLQRCCRNA
ncbi:MAG: hypothetical protein AUK29_07220 [Nitrospirae bacterium CG2_30_53_67]|nr:MAG: hypothetical protein AUK29_07220 [Nitrospirae bacterium CG2_30_53_67]